MINYVIRTEGFISEKTYKRICYSEKQIFVKANGFVVNADIAEHTRRIMRGISSTKIGYVER